jgi:PEP-CTERM motif
MRKSLWIILALLLGAGAGTARADIITLAVSSILVPISAGVTCSSPSPCTLTGTLTIDNTTGAIQAAAITLVGALPSPGPFTNIAAATYDPSMGSFSGIADAASTYFMSLQILPSPGPFPSGYTGGPLYVLLVTTAPPLQFIEWGAPTTPTGVGQLTVPTPEPDTVGLLLFGFGLVFVMRKRIAKGLPQAA